MSENFQQYLAKRRVTATPAGDFTRDARSDPEMASMESWPELQAYLHRKSSAAKLRAVVAAAEPVWKGYRAYILKSRRQS